jgi:hypothetical protein
MSIYLQFDRVAGTSQRAGPEFLICLLINSIYSIFLNSILGASDVNYESIFIPNKVVILLFYLDLCGIYNTVRLGRVSLVPLSDLDQCATV